MKTYSRNSKANSLNRQTLPEEYENACRLCLAKDNVLIYLYNEDDIVPISLKIRYCLALEITEDDGLPSGLCCECASQLDVSYVFKKRCLATEVKLRQYIKHENCNSPKFPEQKFEDFEEPTLLKEDNNTEKSRDACTMGDDQLIQPPLNLFQRQDSPSTDIGVNSDAGDGDDQDEEYDEEILLPVDSVKEKKLNISVMTVELNESCENKDTSNQRRSQRIMLKKKLPGKKSKSYKCSSCPLKFTAYRELLDHVHNTHPDSLKACPICSKLFLTNSTRDRHVRVHTGERPFVCKTCKKSFSQKEILNRHIFTHSEEKAFKCEFCELSFSVENYLRNHVRNHHRGEVGAYKCQQCNKIFRHVSGLSRHKITHAGVSFKCNICERIFSDRSSVKRHCVNVHPNVT